MLSFIFIYSLFLSIPLPYLSQPPLGSCPISRDRPAHQTGGLGDVLTPGDVSASPALTRLLDTLLFPFSLPWKGFPPSLPPFPATGGVAESTAAGSWLRRAHRGAPSLRQKSRTPPHPSTLGARRRPRCPCCPGASSRPGLPGLPAGSREQKIGIKGALSGAGTGRLGRWCAGRSFWRGGVVAGGEGVPAGRQGPAKPSPHPSSGARFRKCFARR